MLLATVGNSLVTALHSSMSAMKEPKNFQKQTKMSWLLQQMHFHTLVFANNMFKTWFIVRALSLTE